MIGRPIKTRVVAGTPKVAGFNPYGKNKGENFKETIFLLYEEYEALRLCDYENNNQTKAAETMKVSRPTFTRIYMRARNKIAKAFVEGHSIHIEGGKVSYDNAWYKCNKCNSIFNNPKKGNGPIRCPLCNSLDIDQCRNEGGIIQ